MIARSRRRRHEAVAELNITAFLNLMVILVPFLLITAVFSRVAVLELNLPGPSSAASEEQEQQFNLEVTVRETVIDVGDRNTGLLKRFDRAADGSDYRALSAYLVDRVKRDYPEKTEATLLLEPDIEYDVIVQVMDTLMVANTLTDGLPSKAELFPDITIGDAPADDGSGQGGRP